MPLFGDECLIDLVEYGKRKKRGPSRHSFANPIVLLADDLVRRYTPEAELKGILSSIRHQFKVLHWRDYLWILPIASHRFTAGSFDVEGQEWVLPKSVVATALHYRLALDESATGLRRIIFAEFVAGVEWACYESIYRTSVRSLPEVPQLAWSKVEEYVCG